MRVIIRQFPYLNIGSMEVVFLEHNGVLAIACSAPRS